jgi:uncharacterized protein (DUF1330 family)
MKAHYAATLAMLAGFGLGAVAVHNLHAQAKPPAYLITEIDVLENQEAYMKDYVPKIQASIKAAGGKYLVAGGSKITAVEGEPPKRFSVTVWDGVEKIQAWRNSATFKDLLPMREKLAKFRSFAVEGVSQ